jgi:hypothetical protein
MLKTGASSIQNYLKSSNNLISANLLRDKESSKVESQSFKKNLSWRKKSTKKTFQNRLNQFSVFTFQETTTLLTTYLTSMMTILRKLSFALKSWSNTRLMNTNREKTINLREIKLWFHLLKQVKTREEWLTKNFMLKISHRM